MPELTRRELLQILLAGGARAALPAAVAAEATAGARSQPPSTAAAVRSTGGSECSRERVPFDDSWRFHLGHAQDPARDFGFGARPDRYAKNGSAPVARAGFDDGDWEAVQVPHDWAVALPFTGATPGIEPGADDPAAAHGFKPLGRACPATSIGWYRRAFDVPAGDHGRRVTLEFDGVFRDCLVICNGKIVAQNASGYCGFSVDLSDVLDYGRRNVVAVRVDASLGEGRFYEGAGICRHVWLCKTDPLHLARDGTFVRSELREGGATLLLGSEIRNAGADARDCRVAWIVRAPDGRDVARTTADAVRVLPGETRAVAARLQIDAPALWSVDTPHLYALSTQLYAAGAPVDAIDTRFGIRTFAFDAQRGFLLNGEVVKLKGTCNHQHHAGVGTAMPDRLQEWRIARLKGMGSNAYRSAHDPPTPELLDACDRLGMLVIAETGRMASSDEGLGELERMVRRDRNHACVMLWSLGNEEPQIAGDRGARIVRSMQRLAKRLDPSRSCTFAMDRGWGLGVPDVVDVIGFNYRVNQIDGFHRRFPDRPVIGTETGSTVCTRGVYRRDDARGFVRAYDVDHPWWGSTAEAWWSHVAERPYVGGGFVRTGFDCRGATTPFDHWPNVASQAGILDSCGFPKDNYWYYRAQWAPDPVLHLFPHWNWDGLLDPGANGHVDVWCHSNLDSVELLVNGVSQGVQKVPPYGHVEWHVKYAPGAVEARGFRAGKLVLVRHRETAGAAARVSLRSDRGSLDADGRDVAVVAVAIVDARGRVVPTADNEVQFSIDGPARLIGVGNGDPASHESDKAPHRRAFNGLCMAIVQAGRERGAVRIRAGSAGLARGELQLGIGGGESPRRC